MSARATTPPATPVEPPVHVPKHQAFSWLHRSLKDDAHAEFVALTYDICRGAGVCLQLAQESELDRIHDPRDGYLSTHHVEKLEMMAIRSLQLLADRAEEAIEIMNTVAQEREVGGVN